MNKVKFLFLSVLFFVAFLSCSEQKSSSANVDEAEQSNYFNHIMDSIFDYEVSLSPVRQAYLGIKDQYDKWDVSNDSTDLFFHELEKEHLAYIVKNFNPEHLDEQAALTYRLYQNNAKQSINNFEWRYHNYPVNQMFGTHTWIPNFLMSIHQIDNQDEAIAWLARLNKVDEKMEELIEKLNIRKEMGIIPPKFVFAHVKDDCSNLMTGYPLDDSSTKHPLYDHFIKKLEKLEDISEEKKRALEDEAVKTLQDVFKPAYGNLVAYLEKLETNADDKAGVWKLPRGDEYYKIALKKTTTTDFTPNEIFEIGMSEVKRIHSEMEKIMEQVGFEGDLQDFFKFMQEDEQFFFPNTDEGRQAYIDANIVIIDAMKAKLDDLFITKPKAELEVKRVEPFREKSAGIAFYQSPAPDGSRPGTYYANLYDMQMMPKYEMEALSYHEAIPGHHMQIAIAQELEGLPKYRTIGSGYTAYSEGWGLYSELLPKEYGFYEDPYSDFGRLSMELWRACRLVVDVGIHDKKWTREEGIDFYKSNTSASMGECVKMVERHIVMPSQATAYKIGQLKILELREKAQKILADKFDIKAFHEVVLTNGSVPLNILEELVNNWIGDVLANL